MGRPFTFREITCVLPEVTCGIDSGLNRKRGAADQQERAAAFVCQAGKVAPYPGGFAIVISLKKYLDMEIQRPQPVDSTDDLLKTSFETYGSSLRAMADNGARVCPALGSDLQQSLVRLAEQLAGQISAPGLAQVGSEANEQLQIWGCQTAEYFQARTAEVKELLIVLAGTAASVGERNQEYSSHFQQLTTQLRTISNLEDLTQVRASLVQQAAELKTYVDRMEQDSQHLVRKLQADVTTYEAKLKKVEELAMRDALTGLANRRNLEERVQSRIALGKPFCVLMLDLNGLKRVNDQHGHLAGDNLLQQFGQELRSSSRSSDTVGRWGGDEFLVVMEGDEAGARAQIERLQKWVFGKYTVRPGKGSGEVAVDGEAAVGLAQWHPGESMKMLVERADEEMYKQKKTMAKRQGA